MMNIGVYPGNPALPFCDAAIDALSGRVDILERETARNRTPPCERRRYFE
jgi:hypothetical protein